MEQEGRPAEIGEGTDYIEITAFTGDFIKCHGGLLLLGGGWGRLKIFQPTLRGR